MYLTVLRAHSREGHLQYLQSLEADLFNAAQIEDDGAEESESVPGSSIDKEGEAGACELGIRYPKLQAIYAGKLNKQSIQVISTYDIIYNVICSYMIYAGELNAILESNVVPNHNGKGQLRTFCCIQWECGLYSGRPKARCYPFNLSGHRFRGKNRQVFHII